MIAIINIPYLTRAYFAIDAEVPYQLKSKEQISIKPVPVEKSEVFMSCADIFSTDKNSINSPEVISMTYLEFVLTYMRNANPITTDKLVMLFKLSLDEDHLRLVQDPTTDRLYLSGDKFEKMTAKDFDDFRRIVLYQNIIHYDDEYVNPELKAAMDEMNDLRRKNIEYPDLERRCAIITAHCGLPKREQLTMTMRSHSLLFEEVKGEVDYITTRPIALYAGKDDKITNWITPRKRGKYDQFFVDEGAFNKSMGGNGQVATINSSTQGDALESAFNSFQSKS